MATDKGKKAKVCLESADGAPDNIDKELVLSIEKLQEIQDELEKINEEASDKVLEVEQKYNEIRHPVYSRRNEIIEAIPDFWLTAFLSHPALCDLLNEHDQKIFKYLKSLEVEDFKDVKSGYSIVFIFSSNPYFEETKLTKTFHFSDEGATKIVGTTIKWKEGMDNGNGVDREKKGNKRLLTEDSFFTWFSETENKSDIIEGIHDEVAEIIKEDLWPNPLKYFNNEADEEGFDSEEEEDDDLGKSTDGMDDGDGGDDDEEGS